MMMIQASHFLLLIFAFRWTRALGTFTISQHTKIDLLRRPENRNNITLLCRNNSIPLRNADFWVNSSSTRLDLLSTDYRQNMAEIEFNMKPEFEGYFYCGNISAAIQSSNNLTLLAYPTQRESFLDHYSANVGDNVTLICPFRNGALIQHYTYSWVQGFSTVLIDSDPGFVGNSSDFSLTIQCVTLSHAAEYRCGIEIENPHGNNLFDESDPIHLVVDDDENSTSLQSWCHKSPPMTPTSKAVTIPMHSVSHTRPETDIVLPSVTIVIDTNGGGSPRGLQKFLLVVILIIVCVSFVALLVSVTFAIVYRERAKRKTTVTLEYNFQGRECQPVPTTFDLMTLSNGNNPDRGSNHSENTSLYVQTAHSSLNIDSTGSPSLNLNMGDNLQNPSHHCDIENNSMSVQAEDIAIENGIVAQLRSSVGSTGASLSSGPGNEGCTTEHSHGMDEDSAHASSTELPQLPQERGERSIPTHLLLPSQDDRERAPVVVLPTQDNPGHHRHPSGTSDPNMPSHASFTTGQSGGFVLSPLSGSVTYNRSCPSQSAETVFLLEPIADYQDSSNDFVFLGSTQILVCDAKGGRYNIPDHGISLRIPPEALQGCNSVELEVGVAIHGNFLFPNNLQPISAILWLAVRDNPEFVFLKPIEICLPHFLNLCNDDATNSSELGLAFMMTDEQTNAQEQLIFTEGATEQVTYLQTRAKIKTNHFCFLCLSAAKSLVVERSRYLLTQAMPDPVKALQWKIHFYVSYDLESFVKMIQDQHSQMKVSGTPFQFAVPSEGAVAELKINFNSTSYDNKWKIAFPDKKQVKQSDIHQIWENDVSDLQRKIQVRAYPPQITVEIAGQGAFDNATESFSFDGGVHGVDRLCREIHLVLPEEYVEQNKEKLQFLRQQSQPTLESNQNSPLTTVATRSSSSPHSNTPACIPDEPTHFELVQVMQLILGKFRSWHILIHTLGIPEHIEQEILQDTPGVKTQILKILNTWKMLHQNDGTCTRANLAAILRQTDVSLLPAARALESPRQPWP